MIRALSDRSLEHGVQGMRGHVVEGADGAHVYPLELWGLDVVVTSMGSAEKTHEKGIG